MGLESLPNSAIPTVQISADFDDVDVFTLSVSFTDAATTGLQNLLKADIVASTETCSEGGQSPYTQNPVLYDTVTVSVDHQPLTEGSSYEENVPCGNRGICDSSVASASASRVTLVKRARSRVYLSKFIKIIRRLCSS